MSNDSTPTGPAAAAQRDPVLNRMRRASRRNLLRGCTEPALPRQWFVPKPGGVARAEVDLRPDGAGLSVRLGPDGTEVPNPGGYLEVGPDRRSGLTDAFEAAWVPAPKPSMTAILMFATAGDGTTRGTARGRRRTAADRETHEKLGFPEGRRICSGQREGPEKKR